MTAAQPPSGWYPDPADASFSRYWDGSTWTQARKQTAGAAPRSPHSSAPTGKQLMRASFDLFRQNRQMIWLPILAGVISATVFMIVTAIVAVPLISAFGSNRLDVFYILPGLIAASFAGVFFNVALVFAANEQIEGRTIGVSQAVAMAWARRVIIFKWAVLAGVVGTVLQFIEQRLGFIGWIARVAGGLAWAVATYMVIPVLAFEEVGPVEAVKESSRLLKDTFGSLARGALRFGGLFVVWMLAAAGVIVVGFVTSVAVTPFLGVPIAIAGVLGFFVVAMYISAASMYMRTILFRYAKGETVPDFDLDLSKTFQR